MSYLKIDSKWETRLLEAGLGSLEEALEFEGERLLSRKRRSRTWLHVLPCGQTLFVKQDTRGRFAAVLRALLHFQKPLSATEREFEKMKKMTSRGFRVAQVILCGASRRLGFLPDRAVMVSLPVAGISLEDIYRSEASAATRERARKRCLQVLEELWDKGCDWGKDAKPEHFFLDEKEQVSLIDVERMRFRSSPVPMEQRRMQLERFQELLARACAGTDS